MLSCFKVTVKSYLCKFLTECFLSFSLGIFLLLTPVYIIGNQPEFDGQNIGSAIFCYTIANQFLVFTFGIVSMYTVTLLAVERWFAVFRPLQYRTQFRPHKVRKYLITVWLSSFAVNSTHIIETKYLFHSEHDYRCVFRGIAGNDARAVIGVLEMCIKFVVPAVILIVTFTHLYHFMKDSSGFLMTSRRSHVVITRVTNMAAITSFVMVLCWFPNQLFYLLFKLNVVQLNTAWHRATVILCMFNSCLNPCIFLFSNKLYRKKAKELLPSFFKLVKKGEISLAESRPVPPQAVLCVKFTKAHSLQEDTVEIFEHALTISEAIPIHELDGPLKKVFY